jgi:GMP synthase (glutamine-hydrolysing)
MNKIIAVAHDQGDLENRCSRWLDEAGYDVVPVCPAAGEPLPALDSTVSGVVVFGGRYDVNMKDDLAFLRHELRLIEDTLARGLPYLGICLGGQLLAHVLGETVDRHPEGWAEYGYYELMATEDGREFVGEPGLKVLQSHWHGWYRTPGGATRLAFTEAFPEQAFRYGANAYALQFHPEATRAMLETWISRRPPERYLLRGSHRPERQRADFLAFDAQLGTWFAGFLARWIGPVIRREAAE